MSADHSVDFASITIPANPWGVNITDKLQALKIVAERLSIVRYVFLVQIEDGIASAAQRASLEYADAVLIGWPESDDVEDATVQRVEFKDLIQHIGQMESYIRRFCRQERDNDIDGMTDVLIRITERAATVRRCFQPDFPLPTFAEIRRVVQDEWDEDMGKINPGGDQVEATLEESADGVLQVRDDMPHE